MQKVEVNGQPAALIGGSWNADTGQWDGGSDLTLSWMKGDQMYLLRSPGAPVEDLIRMAVHSLGESQDKKVLQPG